MRNPRYVAGAVALIVAASVAGSAAYATTGSERPATVPTTILTEPTQQCQTTANLPTTDSSAPTTTAAPGVTTTTEVPLPIPVNAPADNEPEPQQYFGRLQIPAIDVDSPFLEGIRLSTLDYGPGHWPCTAMPGELGNVVVAGHRTSHNADFRRLDELVAGDEVIFDMDNSDGIPTATVATPDGSTGVFVYHVSSVEIVAPEALWIVTQNYRHEATLFACHPPGRVSERIVVHLDLFSVNGEPAPVPPDPARTTTTVAG